MFGQPLVLIIEDQLTIRRFIRNTLINQAYRVLEADSAEEGINQALQQKPDVVLLDLELPDQDGLAVIKSLRAWTAVPIIVLSARDQEKDKIVALDAGADDYLTKPFAVNELSARLRVALRHAERILENESPLLVLGDLQIDLLHRTIKLNNKDISLSPNQYEILVTLAKRANKIVTHKQLLREVWGEHHTQDIEYLRIYIYQLRHKLGDNPTHPKFLKTEPGVGYRLMG